MRPVLPFAAVPWLAAGLPWRSRVLRGSRCCFGTASRMQPPLAAAAAVGGQCCPLAARAAACSRRCHLQPVLMLAPVAAERGRVASRCSARLCRRVRPGCHSQLVLPLAASAAASSCRCRSAVLPWHSAVSCGAAAPALALPLGRRSWSCTASPLAASGAGRRGALREQGGVVRVLRQAVRVRGVSSSGSSSPSGLSCAASGPSSCTRPLCRVVRWCVGSLCLLLTAVAHSAG